jgi:hypothetical protein
MSAIGSYAILRRSDFPACVDSALHIRSESTGKWLFKKTELVGINEFKEAWQAAVVEEAHFDYSGYVLGNYLDAQQVVNQIQVVNEQSEVARALCKMFTAAFPFEVPVTLPDLAPEPLFEFCREEYGEDAKPMVEALNAAHFFYQEGLRRITLENLVIFIIR